MKNTISVKKASLIIGLPVLLIVLLVLISKLGTYNSSSNYLFIGVTFDLLVTVPLVYLLLIRKTSISKLTLVPVLIAAMIIGTLIIPSAHQEYLNFYKTWIFPLVELFIISYVIYHLSKVVKKLKAKKEGVRCDFYSSLQKTCSDLLPKKAVMPVVMEISVFYYGFINWKKPNLRSNDFTYHKNSGTIALLGAILLVVAIETVAFHALLSDWNIIVAWVFTGLSIYTGLQMFGFMRSMPKRPISVENNRLYLRYGIMAESTIDICDIERIEITSKDIEVTKETRKLSFLGQLESHNTIIKLKKEHTIIGLYGIKRTYKNIALFIDNPSSFKSYINNLKQP